MKDALLVPPLPTNIPQLQRSSRMKNTRAKVWVEMELRIDVCRVTRGAHTDCLYDSKKISEILYRAVYVTSMRY